MAKLDKEKLFHEIYGDMCAATFLFCHEFGKKVSIEKEINKSKILKKWAKDLTKSIYESAHV